MEILIITGQSGAGKSHVAHILEDMGYYCVDNMPMELLASFAEMCIASKGRYERVVLVTDIRAGQSFDALFNSLALIRAMNCEYRIVFVEARSDVILRRYKETRRRHPLAEDGEPLERALTREAELLRSLRGKADIHLDTTGYSPTTLRKKVEDIVTVTRTQQLPVSFISFGFKYGLPQEADLVFDVRFLPNPYHIEDLRALSGLDQPIRDFVLKWPEAVEFMRRIKGLLEFLIPLYLAEGKYNLVVAVGCTGGRHRSVTVAYELNEYLLEKGLKSSLTNRDVYK